MNSVFSFFHKSHSYLILKTKQTSFFNKLVCYLESQGLQNKALGSQSGLSPRPSGPAQPGSSLLGSLSSLFALPASQKDANWVMSADSRQSPGKGDEGRGTAFCQAHRPLLSFPRAWWGLQEIASECSPFPRELLRGSSLCFAVQVTSGSAIHTGGPWSG